MTFSWNCIVVVNFLYGNFSIQISHNNTPNEYTSDANLARDACDLVVDDETTEVEPYDDTVDAVVTDSSLQLSPLIASGAM